MNAVQEIVNDFLQARLPLSVSSYQIRCVSEEIAQAIEAQRAATVQLGAVADESAVGNADAPKGATR
jgi:hypothetical protein